jgi:uncharacterized protein involved in exopolysaccharide biosynthesis
MDNGTSTGTDSTPGIVVHRRWPVILASAIIVGFGATVWTVAETDLYRARAYAVLTRTSIEASLTGTRASTAHTDPAVMARTEANLAELPVVVRRTMRAAGLPSAPNAARDFTDRAFSEVEVDSPVVAFVVDDADADRATLLAATWARTTDAFRVEVDTRALNAALRAIEAPLGRLERTGDTSSQAYRSLIDKQQQLETMLTLQRASATIGQPTSAVRVTRSPLRAGVLGTLAGAILGMAIAFLWELIPSRDSPRDLTQPLRRRERAERVLR